MLEAYLNEKIVVDTDSRYTYIGYLVEISESFLCLRDAAVFNADESHVTIDQYLDECATHGYPISRRRVWLRLEQVVSVSRLRDIVKPGSMTSEE